MAETLLRRIFRDSFFHESIMGGVVFTNTCIITPPIITFESVTCLCTDVWRSATGRIIIIIIFYVMMACEIYVESCVRGYHARMDARMDIFAKLYT